MAEGPFEADERTLIPSFVPPWGFRPRADATYFPMPWLLSSAGLRGAARQQRGRACSASAATGAAPGASEVQARELRLRVFAGPRPADVLRRAHRAHRPPAAPAGAVRARPLVPAPRRRGARSWLGSSAGTCRCRWRRPTPTTCPARTSAAARPRSASRVRRFHAAGLAVTTYFNPMICTRHTRYGDVAGAGALVRGADGRPYVYRYSTLERFDVAQFDFTAPAGPARSTGACCARPSPTDTTAGWRTSASTRRSDARFADGSDGRARCTTATRRQYHCAAYRAAPRARALRALGLDRHRAAARRSCGAATRASTGASTACAPRSCQRADDGPVGREHLGLGHRRLLRARGEPPHARAADPLDPGGRGVRGDAHAGQRHPHPGQRATPDLGPRDRGPLAPLGEAAHPALPLPGGGRRRVPRARAADHAPPGPRLPGRPPAGRGSEDAFMFGPDLLAAPVLGPGRAAARAWTCRAAAGSTSGARCASSHRGGGLALGRARMLARRSQRARCPRRWTSCRCSRGPARCCRCSARTWTPWPPTAIAHRRCRCASAPAAACCWPSREGGPGRGWRTAVA